MLVAAATKQALEQALVATVTMLGAATKIMLATTVAAVMMMLMMVLW
jgi:hypothetical protein